MYKKIIYTFENSEELEEAKTECATKLCCDCKYSDLCTDGYVYWEFDGKLGSIPCHL